MMKRIALLPLLVCLSACAQFGGGANTDSAASAAPSARAAQPPRDAILNPRGIDFSRAPEVIAFGSCALQTDPQPIWKSIIATDPDLFISSGDIVYANKPNQQPIAEQYRILSRIPEYREARVKIPFMATWDDGEFGTGDGGADAPTKAAARKEFLTHFRYIADSIPIGREGIYHSKTMGGQVTGRRRKRVHGPTVQVIMLDTRTFRSPLNRLNDPERPLIQYAPTTDRSATLLGEDQWDWLESQLKNKANLNIIVSSIQVIPTQPGFEKWANIPHERERLFNLIKKSGAKNVILISGDRHHGSISKMDLKGWGTLYEVTASALNRPGSLDDRDEHYLQPGYQKENFGVATVDWARKKVKLDLRDIDGKTIVTTDVKLR